MSESKVKTILIAWELGGGLGHVMRAAAYARELAQHGVRTVVVLRELANCHLAQWPSNVSLLQAPLANRTLERMTNQSNFGEILFSCGYHDHNQVDTLITGWLSLFDLVAPDLIITDHAPTAQLAAGIREIPVVRIGTGFFAPPAISPTPTFRTWQPIDEKRMRANEGRVLEAINSALIRHNKPRVPSVGAALTPELDLIASWPELDCYASSRPQRSAIYIGNERGASSGIAPQWPRNDVPGRKKIAAYFKGDYAALEAVLSVLQQGYSVVAYVSNLSLQMRERFTSENIWFASSPIDLLTAAESCDAAVFHGGAGTAPLFLEAGKPVLLLPYQAEQHSNSDRIVASGAGLLLEADIARRAFGSQLAQLVSQPRYATAAQTLAQRWAGKEDAIKVGASHIMDLLANGMHSRNVIPTESQNIDMPPSALLSDTTMQVEVTTRCNFDCFYCAGRDMPQKDMDYETFCRLLDQHIAKFDVPPFVSLQGEGEPTINRDFFRMAARVKEVGSRPYTITNGTHKDWEEFLPLFGSIGVSVDTLDEEEAKKIGRYNLPRVMEFVENVSKHMPVIVHTVALGPGTHAVAKWCSARGLRHVVQPLQNKADYQYRYPQFVARKIKEERFSCKFLDADAMRYYNLEGTELPCPFIKSTSQFPGVEEMKHLHQIGQRPACCNGCTMTNSARPSID